MGWLVFLPLLLFPQWLNWAAWQGMVAALFGSFLLLYYARQKAFWYLPWGALPWLLWPLFLFVISPAYLELFSEQSLRLCATLALALLVFAHQDAPQRSSRLGIIGVALALSVQIYGIAVRHPYFSQSSLFAQENVFQFMNLLAMGFLVWQIKWGKLGKAWHRIAFVLLCIAFSSMILGDALIQGKWEVSGGKAIGIWLGLLCGLLAAGGCWLSVRVRLPLWILMCIGTVVVALWAMVAIIALYMPFWNADQPSSVTSRLVFWQATWGLIRDHFWSGVGYGAFAAQVQNYWPTISNALFPVQAYPIAAHSHQLHVWAETGVFGWLWSVTLWGVPWLWFLWCYTRERNPQHLFWIGYLAALQTAMLVLEVSQMFAISQLGAWTALLYAARSMLNDSSRILKLRSLWVLPIIPLVLVLSWDRSLQLYSRYLSTPSEAIGKVSPDQVENLNKALQIHPRNVPALYFIAELHRYDEKYDQALKAVDALQEISGTQWPVHRMRAEIYHATGNKVEACRHARWPLEHSVSKRDQALRDSLQCP